MSVGFCDRRRVLGHVDYVPADEAAHDTGAQQISWTSTVVVIPAAWG